MHRLAQDPSGEVVQGDIERGLRRPVAADPLSPGRSEPLDVQARGPRVSQCSRQGLRVHIGQQEREYRRHRVRGLSVVRLRVALPHPDDARVPLVAQLDDDRRDPCSLARCRAGDAERVSKLQRQDFMGEAQTHGSASTASRTAGQRRSAPKRNGSSVGSPVSAAMAAMTPRASSSDG